MNKAWSILLKIKYYVLFYVIKLTAKTAQKEKHSRLLIIILAYMYLYI